MARTGELWKEVWREKVKNMQEKVASVLRKKQVQVNLGNMVSQINK